MSRRGNTVLHVNRVGFLGGVERVILTLASGTGHFGYPAQLACPGDGELAKAAEERGIPVSACQFVRMRATANPAVLGRYPQAWLKSSNEVLEACKRHDVRLIHAHHPVGVLYSSRAARLLGIPGLLHVHEVLPARPLYRLALTYAARRVDRFICVSEAGRRLLESVGVDRERGLVIHNGVDASFLDQAPRPRPAVLEGAGPHIGVFGVIEPRKGQHVFLEAAATVARRFPAATFWIVGSVALRDKSSYHDRLRRMADQPELAGRVRFAGFQKDVRAWMQAMDVVALTSVAHESLSMVLLESLALGRPTIGTAVGGGAEAILDGVTGRLVPPGDATRLASAIEGMLDGDSVQLGRQAAADARDRFAPDVFCRRVTDIYDQMLLDRKGS